MCKIKAYTDKMNQYLSTIMCRFDTYLLDKDIQSITDLLRGKFGGMLYDSNFSDDLQQDLDVDGIAEMNDMSISEVVRTPVLIIRNAQIEDCFFNLYIHKYFIAFFASVDEKTNSDLVIQTLKSVLGTLGDVPVNDMILRLFYSLPSVKNTDLWNVLDRTAFPVMDGGIINGNYSDSFDKDDISVDLNRMITPAVEGGKSNVYIQTLSFVECEHICCIEERIGNIIESSQEEISRCFVG